MKPGNKLVTSLFVLAATLLILVLVDKIQVRAAAPLLPYNQDVDVFMCPLSDHQVEESMKAFEKMMPTFQHPRCANCHGGMNPFRANTNHGGGKFDVVLGPDGDLMYNETFNVCQECHGDLKGWEIPENDLAFVGKDAIELCKQMKTGSAEDFMDHITRDRGKTQFIEAAFGGLRAFNESGSEFYEALFDKKPIAEPPPGSHATLIEQAQAWVDSTGGEFKASEACGCEPQRYVLQVDESLVGGFQTDGGALDWNGSTTVQIPIKFNDDGTFTGEATSQRTIKAVFTSKVSCTGTATTDVKWQVNGRIDQENNLLSFSLRFTPSPGTVDCGLPVPLPIPIDNSESPDSPLKKMEMRSFIGESKTVELMTNVPGSVLKDSFKITIVKLD